MAETDDAKSKIATLISNKDTYLSSIDKAKYTDYSDKIIDEKMVDDILGFLYESERYILYLYLIDQEKPLEGKEILVRLYSTVINQKNIKLDSIFNPLTDMLQNTLRKLTTSGSSGSTTSRDISKVKNTKLIKSLNKRLTEKPVGTRVGEKEPVGPEELLQAVRYVKQRSNCDGNCFYNSIGMLSSNYTVMEEEYNKYLKMSSKDQYKIQFQEQSRVRRELTEFLTKIYKLIQGKVDMNTREYKNSPILKYIIKNGAKEFKYVRKISISVGDKYYGSDEEIYLSLIHI